MKTTYLFSAVIAVGSLYSSSVLAQGAAGPVDTPAAQPAAPAADQATPQAAPGAMTPAAIVEKEFAAYDVNKDGGLDETEFASWVTKLRQPAPAGTAEEDAQAWAAGLFARADTDKNQSVSKTEMASLISAARQG